MFKIHEKKVLVPLFCLTLFFSVKLQATSGDEPGTDEITPEMQEAVDEQLSDFPLKEFREMLDRGDLDYLAEEDFPWHFFEKKWRGHISGEYVEFDEDGKEILHPFSVDLHGLPEGEGMASALIQAFDFTVVDHQVSCSFVAYPGAYAFTFVSESFMEALMEANVTYYVLMNPLFSMVPQEITETSITFAHIDDKHLRASGELYRIKKVHKNFPEDIKPGETIKTDKYTQKEIEIPDVGSVTAAPETEVEFKSDSEIEQFNGELISKIRDLPPERSFEIWKPVAITGVRGTHFITKIDEDGSDVLIVLQGQVEFSDRAGEKTVVVGENQKSLCRPGELPSEPEDIDPDKILPWWE